MQTIRLKISDKVYDKFLWLLSKFSKEEIEIVNEKKEFNSTKKYLDKELEEVISGKAKFISHNELENRLNKIV